ncbi:unnamed protein product, partial [Rotaria magnacalcarata]
MQKILINLKTVNIFTGAKIKEFNDDLALVLEDGKVLKSEMYLMAAGRKAVLPKGIELLGIEKNERNYIV